VPDIPHDDFAFFFSREVSSLLLREKLISLMLVQKSLCWHHRGFHVHSKLRIRSKKEAERVGKYMIRPLLSLERLSFDEMEGRVNYQYNKDSPQQEKMDYLKLIARVASHGVRLCYPWKPSNNTLFLDTHSQ